MNPHIRSPRPARPAPRPLLAFALALAVAFAAGCGDKTLILRVDLLSFLTPEEQDAHYGPVPAGITDSVEGGAGTDRARFDRGLDVVTGRRGAAVGECRPVAGLFSSRPAFTTSDS